VAGTSLAVIQVSALKAAKTEADIAQALQDFAQVLQLAQ